MIRLKIKEIARSKGISQLKLGRMADVDIKVVRRIYRNEHENISLPVLDRLARVLQVDIGQLLETIPDDEHQGHISL